MPKKNAQTMLREKRKKEAKLLSRAKAKAKKLLQKNKQTPAKEKERKNGASAEIVSSAAAVKLPPPSNQSVFMARFEIKYADFTPTPMDELLIRAIKGKLPITFLREYCFYAMNLLDNMQVLVVPGVNTCTLVELFNRDDTGRTAYVAAHFSCLQIIDGARAETDSLYTKCPSLSASIGVLCEAFVNQGGNMETVTIRFYGGSSHDTIGSGKPRYLKEREFLADEFNTYFKANGLSSPSIQQPKGHWIRKLTPKQLEMNTTYNLDYIITRHGLWFRKSDMSKEDPSSDYVSPDHPKGKSPARRELFCIVMDDPENGPGSPTWEQREILNKKISDACDAPGYPVPGVTEAGMTGLLLK